MFYTAIKRSHGKKYDYKTFVGILIKHLCAHKDVQLFRILNICDKYYKLKVGSNATRGDGVHCDRNEVDGKIAFFVPRLQIQQREFSRVFSVLK